MIIEVDTSSVPAVTRVVDAHDFKRFDVRLLTSGHVWIAPDTVESLVPGGVDDTWRTQFDAMKSYAESKGWVDEYGRIRAHVTTEETAR